MARRNELDPNEYGIFAGSDGLQNVSTMDVEQASDYYSMTRTCEVCGQLRECQIPWAELYCIAQGVMPQDVGRAIRRPDLFDTQWKYSQTHKCLHPDLRCNCSNNPLVMYNLTPVLANKVLTEAGRNGIISDAQQNLIRTIGPVIAQMKGQPRPVPQQMVPQPQMQGYPMYPPGYGPPRR